MLAPVTMMIGRVDIVQVLLLEEKGGRESSNFDVGASEWNSYIESSSYDRNAMPRDFRPRSSDFTRLNY